MEDRQTLGNGVCKFCGQLNISPEGKFIGAEEADEYASLNCNCPESEKYSMKERSRKIREDTLNRANEEIEDLYGEGCRKYGLTSIGEDIKDMIKKSAELIYDGDMKDISISVSSSTKVKISKSAKSKIQINRNDVAAFKKEA